MFRKHVFILYNVTHSLLFLNWFWNLKQKTMWHFRNIVSYIYHLRNGCFETKNTKNMYPFSNMITCIWQILCVQYFWEFMIRISKDYSGKSYRMLPEILHFLILNWYFCSITMSKIYTVHKSGLIFGIILWQN